MKQLTSPSSPDADLRQVQLRLQESLIKPIDVIAQIVSEQGTDEWDLKISRISFLEVLRNKMRAN